MRTENAENENEILCQEWKWKWKSILKMKIRSGDSFEKKKNTQRQMAGCENEKGKRISANEYSSA